MEIELETENFGDLVVVEDLKNSNILRVMQEIRTTFARGDWNEVVEAYEGSSVLLKGQRVLRLEAACLAARAWVVLKDRNKARALLKPLMQAEYKKPVHYEFLARALLDLKQYDAAAKACEKAHALRQGMLNGQEASDRGQSRNMPAPQ